MKHTRHLISLAFAALALVCAADVTRDTEWQDVPPITRIGTVVDLGGGGLTPEAVTNIADAVVASSNLCTVAAAQAMTNDATIVRGTVGEHQGSWGITVDYAYRLLGPIYWDSIINPPMTLSGYGIIDAKIENGIIRLGSQTITPIVTDGDQSISGSLVVQELLSSGRIDSATGFTYLDNDVVYGISTDGGSTYSHGNVDLSIPTQYTDAMAVAATAVPSTNAAEAVFSANADYALTNCTTASFALSSGQIGNVSMVSDVTLTLDFSSAGNRSGDCLLYAINATGTDYDVNPTTNGYTVVSSDLAKALTIGKATTNILMFTRIKSDTILISKQEVK